MCSVSNHIAAFFLIVPPHTSRILQVVEWQVHYLLSDIALASPAQVGSSFAAECEFELLAVVNCDPVFLSLLNLCSFNFLAGLAVFIFGAYITRSSERILQSLRKPGERGYKVCGGANACLHDFRENAHRRVLFRRPSCSVTTLTRRRVYLWVSSVCCCLSVDPHWGILPLCELPPLPWRDGTVDGIRNVHKLQFRFSVSCPLSWPKSCCLWKKKRLVFELDLGC